MTTDRSAGIVLVVVGLFVMEECWRTRLPLGTLRNPGPAFTPVVLALLVLIFGAVIVGVGGRAVRLAAVGWSEWRHAVAIFGVCAFSALALERLGYRLTVTVVLAALVGVLERKGVLLTAAVALGLAFGSFYVFNTLLLVPLPLGPFGF